MIATLQGEGEVTGDLSGAFCGIPENFVARDHKDPVTVAAANATLARF